MDVEKPEGAPDIGAPEISAPDISAPVISEGGDPACWLAQLCPECGAVLESHSDPCWRCGLRPGDVDA